MFSSFRSLGFGIVLTACMAAAACSSGSDITAEPTVEAQQVEFALDQDNGGLDSTDEAAAFSDSQVQATPALADSRTPRI